MKNKLLMGLLALAALSACTPVRMVGNTAIGATQVVVGAADLVI